MSVPLADIVISAMARRIKGPVLAGGVTPCTQLAVWLAHALHDRTVTVLLSEGTVARPFGPASPQLPQTSLVRAQEAVPEALRMKQLSLEDVFSYVAAGAFQIWISPAQIDAEGSANISAIGPYGQPKVALVGSRGLPDDGMQLAALHYLLVRHTKRSTVPQVDFASAVGHTKERKDLGRREGAPEWLVSDLGVFRWVAGRPEAVSLHPGVTPERVVDATGFAVSLPDGLSETPLPSKDERSLIARMDPHGFRLREFPDGAPPVLLDLLDAEAEA